MIPSRTRIAFLFRRWYWNQPFVIRRVLRVLPDWLLAIALGLTLAWLAAQGF